jgi:hypothetical protein
VTAGDGYQCSNEKMLLFGCDQASVVDEVKIRWPSGTEQIFRNLPASSEWIIVEDRAIPLAAAR